MSTRRLAAIMFSDIVGYTALIGKDEKKAFEYLKKNRRIHWRLIRKYKGKLLKEIGDGILASFNSNIDAVMCSFSIQTAAKETNIPLRVGIHQGDVIFEKKDVLGDGVNIASRIQGVAKTNEIVISDTVYKDIKNKEGIKTEFLGERSLKGVKEPTGVYSIQVIDEEILSYKIDTGELIRPLVLGKSQIAISILAIAVIAIVLWFFFPEIVKPSSEPQTSVAVLPFDFQSEDSSQVYLSNGVMDVLIGHLSRIAGLQVKSRTTVEQYRETTKTASDIGEELKVSYLLEGSFQMQGTMIRLILYLVNPKEESQVWFDEYNLEKDELFNKQSEIAQTIAEELKVILSPQEKMLINSTPTINEEAYDYFLKGRELEIRAELEPDFHDIDTVIYYYKRAIELEPRFALAYVHLGMQYYWNRFSIDYLKDSFADTLLYFAEKAISLDPNLAKGYWLKGRYFQQKGENENSIIEFEKAIKLDPNDGDSYLMLSQLYNYSGEILLAIKNGAKAKKLFTGSYKYQNTLFQLGIAYFYIGDNTRGYATFEELKMYDVYKAYNYLPALAWMNQEWDKCKQYIDEYCAFDSINCIRYLSEYYRRTKNFPEAYKYELKRREIWKTRPDPRYLDDHKYGYILYNMGKKEEAMKLFNSHIDYCKEMIRLNRPWQAMIKKAQLAFVYSFLGEREKVFELIYETENELAPMFYTSVKGEPISENLWEDEEFKKIFKRQEKRKAEMQAEVEKMDKLGLL